MKKYMITVMICVLCIGMLFYRPVPHTSAEDLSPAAVIEIETASNGTKKEERSLSAMELGMAEAICRLRNPQTVTESLEEEEETEASVFYLTDLKDEKGVSYAEKLLKELIGNDAGFFSNIYDRMINIGKEDEKASVTVSFVNGDSMPVTASSNVQKIVSMASVYAKECSITDWSTIRRYAVTLWERSHSFTETAETIYCEEGECSVLIQTASNSNYAEPENTEIECPGHICVTLTGMIRQTDEAQGLFAENPNAVEWGGWTDELKEKAITLSEMDWNTDFGIMFQIYEAKTPLSNAEISSYLHMMPEDTSETRKKIIEFALQSVGRVPYYYGGKPSAAGYTGNSFGSFTELDKESRTLRGLDCSGWVNWVYWSASGQRLSYEGTAGLSTLGRAVSLEEMKPGDVALDTGEESHIVIYLGQTEDGTRYCIHESAYRGTVSVSTMSPDWKFYRNLLD